jgi:hypothetical protein
MKKKLTIFTLAVALIAGAVALLGLLAPEPVEAIGGCRCLMERQTVVLTGFGNNSCAAAQADLWSKLEVEAGCDSFCSSSVVFTNACFQDEPNAPTWYKSSGYLLYQCEICLEEPEM